MAGSSPPPPSSHPQERKKVGREAETTAKPISSRDSAAGAGAAAGQGEGAGRRGPMTGNRSGPRRGRALERPAPAPAGPRSSAPPAWLLPPPPTLRLSGGGVGVPRWRILPGAGEEGEEGRGKEAGLGEGRIRKDSSLARARPARGILGKKWPRGRREGAERSRGQRSGPRRPTCRAPLLNAVSGKNLFVFHRPGC